LFYGCLIAGILALIMIIAVAVGMFLLYRFTTRIVEQYTDTTPMALPQPNLDEDQLQALKQRVDDFKKAAEEGRDATLTLTGDELTALLQRNEDFKDRFAVTVEGDELKGQVSLPFDFPGLGRRYFNGSATFKGSLKDGVLIVTVDQAEVKGQPVPENVMEHLRKENLARDAYKNEENARVLRQLKSMEIKDGRITIKSREKSPVEKTDPAKPKEGKAKQSVKSTESRREFGPVVFTGSGMAFGASHFLRGYWVSCENASFVG
jgi:hypothetical protein